MASSEMTGLSNILRAIWDEKIMHDLGEWFDGPDFWVRSDKPRNHWACTPTPTRVYNRPLTKKQHRAHQRQEFKERWIRRLTWPRRACRTAHYRLGRTWDALRGREDEGWY